MRKILLVLGISVSGLGAFVLAQTSEQVNAAAQEITAMKETSITNPKVGAIKACSVIYRSFVHSRRWRDTVTVTPGFTIAACKQYRDDTGASHYQTACIYDSGISLGSLNGGAPLANCGW